MAFMDRLIMVPTCIGQVGTVTMQIASHAPYTDVMSVLPRGVANGRMHSPRPQREYQGWKFKNNWHSTIAELKAQLAVMRGDKALWQAALKQAQEVMDFCRWLWVAVGGSVRRGGLGQGFVEWAAPAAVLTRFQGEAAPHAHGIVEERSYPTASQPQCARACLLVADLHKTGECHETSRDLYHSQFGLGSLLQV